MKRLIALLFVSLVLAQCTGLRSRPHGPDKIDPVVAKDRIEGRDRARLAFENGKADGAADAARGESGGYTAHKGRYDAATEAAYREGYAEGLGQKTGEPKTTPAQQAAHDAGYAAGLRDRRRSRGSDPDQYKGTYDAKLESWFVDGYYEGIEDRN